MRTVAAAFGLLLLVIAPATSPAFAQVNPNGSAVQEQQLLNQLKTIQGLGTIPDTKSYVLEHPAGRGWQYFHNVTLRWIAAIAILGGVSADEAPRSLGIDMLVAGGKTSTLTQFTELARRAGLETVTAGTQASGRFVVECRPTG